MINMFNTNGIYMSFHILSCPEHQSGKSSVGSFNYWNKLPNYVKEAEDLRKFKKLLKTLFQFIP